MSKEYIKLWGELPKPAFEPAKGPTVFHWDHVRIPRVRNISHNETLHCDMDDWFEEHMTSSKYGCKAGCHDNCTSSNCYVPIEDVREDQWCPVLRGRQVAFARELISNGLTSMAATSIDWDIEDEEYHGACLREGWFSKDCAWENNECPAIKIRGKPIHSYEKLADANSAYNQTFMSLNPEAPILNAMKRLKLDVKPQGRPGNHAFKLNHNYFPPRTPYAMYVSHKENIHPWSTHQTGKYKDCSGNPPATDCKSCCHDPCHRTDAIGCLMGLQGELCFNFNRVQKRREDPECEFTMSLTEPFDGNCNCPAKVYSEEEFHSFRSYHSRWWWE